MGRGSGSGYGGSGNPNGSAHLKVPVTCPTSPLLARRERRSAKGTPEGLGRPRPGPTGFQRSGPVGEPTALVVIYQPLR